MDKETALLPHTTLTIGGRAQVLAELAATTGAVGAAWAERLLSWARWAFLFVTLLLRFPHLAHDGILLLLGMGTSTGTATGTERGKDTGLSTRLK